MNMDFATARENMVATQIRPCDVTDARLLAAMADLPRESFLPASLQRIAYMDRAIALQKEATSGISRFLAAPMEFAKLVQLCAVRDTDLALEIGTGCGYGAAVLAQLADSVIALECDPELAARANDNLLQLEISNVAVVEGPLQAGFAAEGPYDVILIAGHVPDIPKKLFDQLKPGGRLVAVTGAPQAGKAHVYLNDSGRISSRAAFDASLPPLPGFVSDPGFVF
jgi:protein-L-isoaspartate(D-aspartate) O-methyltransferase